MTDCPQTKQLHDISYTKNVDYQQDLAGHRMITWMNLYFTQLFFCQQTASHRSKQSSWAQLCNTPSLAQSSLSHYSALSLSTDFNCSRASKQSFKMLKTLKPLLILITRGFLSPTPPPLSIVFVCSLVLFHRSSNESWCSRAISCKGPSIFKDSFLNRTLDDKPFYCDRTSLSDAMYTVNGLFLSRC